MGANLPLDTLYASPVAYVQSPHRVEYKAQVAEHRDRKAANLGGILGEGKYGSGKRCSIRSLSRSRPPRISCVFDT